ncbi:uncharacterized protein TM35_000511050 [Trypanosoma theileri]|uniref:Mucin-associated surface protein (MASP) n=1 Tax=Trypanosoma theileri TaxID=67003 RepID=A0A1X0NGU6_9TRYP|nr:uncharacterized protein TM35_000511050 [Trypanosoma theileri]ORC84004.1 hypothetical protein TM35_000511050 [Trypanosoma theileri]
MSVRNVFCALTIALCCLCSCVVAAQAEALETLTEEHGTEVLPLPVNEHSEVSRCPSGSSPVKGDNPKCSENGGGKDHVPPPRLVDKEPPSEPLIKTREEQPEEGSVSSGTKDGLTERETVEERVEEVEGRHVKTPGVDNEKSGSLTVAEECRGAAVETHSPSRTPAPGGKVQSQHEEEALGTEGQNVDVSPADGRGKGSQTAEERNEVNLEDPPQGELTENARRTEASSTNEVGSTVTEENNGNQQEGGNGVQSTTETSPAPAESDSTRDNVNTTSNEESTTTTTTTTTTLPPQPTNNKKGDADSSSSISSSVWVRVPLLIVVTLACILLVC